MGLNKGRRVALFMPPQLYFELEQESKRARMGVSEFIRAAIRAHMVAQRRARGLPESSARKAPGPVDVLPNLDSPANRRAEEFVLHFQQGLSCDPPRGGAGPGHGPDG
jgi:hypothetical protein